MIAMVLVSTALENFIEDFKLASDKDQVCFDAQITIVFDGREIRLENKVIIVNAALINLDTIYLLNAELQGYGIPETFRSDRDVYTYIPGKCLIIKGRTSMKKRYSITIRVTL